MYLFLVNNRNARKRRKYVPTYVMPFSNVSTVDVEQVNVCWVKVEAGFISLSKHQPS